MKNKTLIEFTVVVVILIGTMILVAGKTQAQFKPCVWPNTCAMVPVETCVWPHLCSKV